MARRERREPHCAHFRDRGYTDVAIDRIFATLDVDLDGEINAHWQRLDGVADELG